MQFYVLAYKKCIIQLFQCKKHIFFLMGALKKNKKKLQIYATPMITYLSITKNII